MATMNPPPISDQTWERIRAEFTLPALAHSVGSWDSFMTTRNLAALTLTRIAAEESEGPGSLEGRCVTTSNNATGPLTWSSWPSPSPACTSSPLTPWPWPPEQSPPRNPHGPLTRLPTRAPGHGYCGGLIRCSECFPQPKANLRATPISIPMVFVRNS